MHVKQAFLSNSDWVETYLGLVVLELMELDQIFVLNKALFLTVPHSRLSLFLLCSLINNYITLIFLAPDEEQTELLTAPDHSSAYKL